MERSPPSIRDVRSAERFDQNLLSKKLNCIKPYLGKILGSEEITVHASIRVTKENIKVPQATSPTLDLISEKIISEVRYRYVKGTLRKWKKRNKHITTADPFFEEIKESGFGDSDENFVTDLLRATDKKHSDQIHYLLKHPRADLIRLRLIKEPFSFLFFLTGKSGSYFIWEMLDGTDASYIWKIGKPLSYLTNHRSEFKQWLRWAEDHLDYIHSVGRNEYLKENPDHFTRIFHDYKNPDGFNVWKNGINHLLESGG